ncbi:hypothetical protein TNCT_234531 [Trichonephila clavata]|uniref:Uncharacterized protein n=1 Tax=Trichonephila clavata TaxID=2740835 RepID=A0A8X6LBM6_TRICU|nr:hypothetical protein TNCT_234531 [Trichonephila clavata]
MLKLTSASNLSAHTQKLNASPIKAMTGNEQKLTRLSAHYRRSGSKFLVDTGTRVHILPCKNFPSKAHDPNLTLYAANETRIPNFGNKKLILDIG